MYNSREEFEKECPCKVMFIAKDECFDTATFFRTKNVRTAIKIFKKREKYRGVFAVFVGDFYTPEEKMKFLKTVRVFRGKRRKL